MSRADRARRSGIRAAGGYTLIEVVVVVVMLASVSIVMNMALTTTRSADNYLKALGVATERGQKVTFEVAGLVAQSRRIYQDDEMGQEYLASLDFGSLVVDEGARLPVIDTVAALDADTLEASFTGNILMFVREADASPAVADAASKLMRAVDTYRMITIFPQQTNRMLFPHGSAARDLVIWRSVAYPSLKQLRAIANSDHRKSVVKDLIKRYGYTHAWDPTEYHENAFYPLESDGQIGSNPEDSTFRVLEDEDLSQRGRLVYANVQLAPTDPDVALRRAILTANELSEWSPNGFEIKVSGPSGSRQIWIHIVVEVPATDGRKAATQACTRIAHTRDF